MTTSTGSSTLILLDTNVLVYALDSQSEHHVPSRKTLERAAHVGSNLCIAQQNLAEFYAVVTDRRRVRVPLAPRVAVETMKSLMSMPSLALLPVPAGVSLQFLDLVGKHGILAQHAFDALLVATMLGNGVSRICTFNRVHFQPFEEIEVMTPE